MISDQTSWDFPKTLQTSKARIQEMIETLGKITPEGEKGVTRFSYSPYDKLAREYFLETCEAIGLEIKVDAVGNIFARLEGKEPDLAPIYSGSHLDSVKNGGQFDGIAGCVAALECVRVMKENGHIPKRPLVVVVFAEEEGSNFKVPVMGSKLLVGELSAEDLKHIKNSANETAFDVITKAGYCPGNMPQDTLKEGDIKAMIELHIEQSIRLDEEGRDLGIVQGIAGMRFFKYVFKGEQNHAGATPMNIRKDPSIAAADFILRVQKVAPRVSKTAVSTAAFIQPVPNIPNVIPGEVHIVCDIRDITNEGIHKMTSLLQEAAEEAARHNSVTVTMECLASSDPVQIKPYMLGYMEKAAQQLGANYTLMPSGAIHDSNYMAKIADVGMIFVPSKDGISHAPEEWTDYEQIKIGADVLLHTLLFIANS